MLSKTKLASPIVAALLAVSGTAWRSCDAADENASCQKFVQSFYDWYVAKSNSSKAKSKSSLEIALNERSDAFGPQLYKQLKEDVAASAKSPGEIVGLDFDPVLNTQEEPQRYKAERVTKKGNSYLVDVYSFSNGKKDAEPLVQPELVEDKGKWQFINFHYKVDKKNDDLAHILKVLRDDRQPHKK